MRILMNLLFLSICWMGMVSSPARAERMSFLDNGTIRIGVDLDIGGTITFLARSQGGENLINSRDLGRQIQQSYYSGPSPFGKPHPGWKNWSWNPIGSGDVYGHPARVVEHKNDGTTLYVKTIPMQWALNNVPGECTFETWVTLAGHEARVRNQLVNHRSDHTQYPAHDQELPAVYTIGKLHRLFSYTGDRPFENQPLTQLRNSGPPWVYWKATENWAALVNDQGWGLGVIHPGAYSFVGGFHGKPNTGGPRDDATGYIAPIRKEILDHNIVYEYQYQLVLGSLEEIRTRPKPAEFATLVPTTSSPATAGTGSIKTPAMPVSRSRGVFGSGPERGVPPLWVPSSGGEPKRCPSSISVLRARLTPGKRGSSGACRKRVLALTGESSSPSSPMVSCRPTRLTWRHRPSTGERSLDYGSTSATRIPMTAR